MAYSCNSWQCNSWERHSSKRGFITFVSKLSCAKVSYSYRSDCIYALQIPFSSWNRMTKSICNAELICIAKLWVRGHFCNSYKFADAAVVARDLCRRRNYALQKYNWLYVILYCGFTFTSRKSKRLAMHDNCDTIYYDLHDRSTIAMHSSRKCPGVTKAETRKSLKLSTDCRVASEIFIKICHAISISLMRSIR